MTLAEQDVLDASEAGGRYLRGASLRLVGFGAGLLVGLGATPFVTRHLGPADWGRYITVTSLIFIVTALTEGGLANLGVRELSTADERERREYMRSLLGLRFALTAVGAAAALVFAALAYPPVMIEGTAIAAVGMFLTNVQATLAVPLIAGLRLGWLALNDFMGQFVSAAALIVLVLAGAPLLPFFTVSVIVGACSLALTVALVHKRVSLRPAFDPRRWWALLSDSIVYAAATALGVIYFRIVVIAVNLLTTPRQVGYFGLGFRVLDLVNTIPWLLVTSAFPILARAAHSDSDRLRYALGRMFEGALIAGGWIALALAVGAPFAVSVVGGHRFASSVTLLRILAGGVPFTFLVATWGFALLSLRLHRRLIVVNGLIVAVAVALSLILIPAAGARGAAVVTLSLEVTLALGYAIALVGARRDLGPDLGRVPRIAAALAAGFAAALAVPIHPAAQVAVGTLVYVAGLWALRAFPTDLVDAVRRRS